MPATRPVGVYVDEALARYGFGHGHPFGPDRLPAFVEEFDRRGLRERVDTGLAAVEAEQAVIERFHSRAYVSQVKAQSKLGTGFLDYGDTPAFPGVYEAAATVVGTTLDAVARVVEGELRRAFVPIAGLHHARRDRAAGFCVFNDCGVAIETLRRAHGIKRVAYVDVDAHHGDGVYYAFVNDPDLIFADIHEDGRYLYPGTGAAEETGEGEAAGTKLNIPLRPDAGDREFFEAWERLERFVTESEPDFVLLQCGADSLAGDPITHLQYTPAAHAHAAKRLCVLAERACRGRLVAMGGGGYDRGNLARAWTGVVEALVEVPVEVK